MASPHPPQPDRIAVHRLTSPASGVFEQLLALYRDAFPPEERKPASTLLTMLARRDYRFYAAQRNAQLIAFAIVHACPGQPVALLEYLAVRHDLRGRGIGRSLVQHVLPILLLQGRTVLIEAESDKLASPEQASRTGRKRFYRSLGGREVAGLDYLMPAVSAGTPPPMDLFVWPVTSASTLDRATLRSWLTSIYVGVYDQRPADPRLAEMLVGLPDPIPLL